MLKISRQTNCRRTWRKFPRRNLEANDDRTKISCGHDGAPKATRFHFGILSFVSRPQNDRCRNGRDSDFVRHRPPVRQSASFPGAGMDQRVFAAFARLGPVPLADPRGSAGKRFIAHLFHAPARDRESARPTGSLPRQKLCEGQLGLAAYGCEWIGCPRIYHLSLAPLHRAQIQSAVPTSQTRPAQSLRRLLDDGLRVPKRLRLSILHRRIVLADAPSHPRLVQLFPIPWSV